MSLSVGIAGARATVIEDRQNNHVWEVAPNEEDKPYILVNIILTVPLNETEQVDECKEDESKCKSCHEINCYDLTLANVDHFITAKP